MHALLQAYNTMTRDSLPGMVGRARGSRTVRGANAGEDSIMKGTTRSTEGKVMDDRVYDLTTESGTEREL